MVYTVWSAFDTFRTDTVDLDPEVTRMGRSSRDYLVDQIKIVAKNNAAFPRLGGEYRPYGSFARRTKIQPLNDIDLLLAACRREQSSSSPSRFPGNASFMAQAGTTFFCSIVGRIGTEMAAA